MIEAPLISVLDDDESLRVSLAGFLRSLGYRTAIHASAELFLNSEAREKTDCLILDVCMPGMGGLELQRELGKRQINIPTIFITAHGDDELCRKVIALGAVDCLQKPFREEFLLKAIGRALSG